MGDYYNKTRGPLSASLTDGSALSIGPKRWIFIARENESSANIIHLLDKGFLVRAKAPRAAPVVPVVPVVATKTPATTEVALRNGLVITPPPPLPTPPLEPSPSDDSVSTSPMKEEFSRKRR